MIPAWLLTGAGRKVSIIVGAAILLWGAKVYIEGRAREQERAKLADENTQQIEKMREADRAATEKILQDAQAKQEAAERRMQASLDREAGLVRTIASLGQQRATALTEVSRLSDSERRPYIIRQLQLRGANDFTPCYTAAEENAIANAITQFPLCQKQVETQSAQILEIKEQVNAQTAKIDAMEVKWDALANYTDRLEGYYRVVWEAVPRKGRKAWPPNCWIFKCNKKVNLPVPAPLDLKKPAP